MQRKIPLLTPHPSHWITDDWHLALIMYDKNSLRMPFLPHSLKLLKIHKVFIWIGCVWLSVFYGCRFSWWRLALVLAFPEPICARPSSSWRALQRLLKYLSRHPTKFNQCPIYPVKDLDVQGNVLDLDGRTEHMMWWFTVVDEYGVISCDGLLGSVAACWRHQALSGGLFAFGWKTERTDLQFVLTVSLCFFILVRVSVYYISDGYAQDIRSKLKL